MAIDRTHMVKQVITDEQIKDGTISYTKLQTDTIQIEVPVSLWEASSSFAIDSTGVKITTARYLISSELLKHAKAVYFEGAITDFSATDSSVDLELYDATAGSVITKITLSDSSERSRTDDIKDSLTAGNEVQARVNVTTASGTSGATAVFKSARLIIVLGVS